ncbi:FmdB family zinc ribbon protein [Catellatospora sp. NPDC049609]|uniref:FmdB family zinc ribbon protein n=1 Tax=Catellatospora sp. NPDC049609 TaxID=3155505 RepID=UPI00342B2A61
MTVYEYVCVECGRFDVRAPIGSAPARVSCPVCAAGARRAFTAPMLGRISKRTAALVERQEQSADAPVVTTHVPPRADRPPTPPHPALAGLPRP